MSLEKGLGLMDIYHEDVRAVGPESSAAHISAELLLFMKLIRAPPGFDSTVLVPSSFGVQCSRVDDSPDDPGISNACDFSDARGASGEGANCPIRLSGVSPLLPAGSYLIRFLALFV